MKGMYDMNDVIKDNVDKALDDIQENKNVYATGRVVRVNKYNIEVSGLNDVSFYEAINVSDKASGYVMGIYPNQSKPFAKFNHTNTIMNDVSLIFQKNSPYDKFQISIDSCGSAFVLIKKR